MMIVTGGHLAILAITCQGLSIPAALGNQIKRVPPCGRRFTGREGLWHNRLTPDPHQQSADSSYRWKCMASSNAMNVNRCHGPVSDASLIPS